MQTETQAGRAAMPDEPKRIRDGGPAFPTKTVHVTTGMSLRDYFAGQALAVMAGRSWDHFPTHPGKVQAWAVTAYAIADAMLAERGA